MWFRQGLSLSDGVSQLLRQLPKQGNLPLFSRMIAVIGREHLGAAIITYGNQGYFGGVSNVGDVEGSDLIAEAEFSNSEGSLSDDSTDRGKLPTNCPPF